MIDFGFLLMKVDGACGWTVQRQLRAFEATIRPVLRDPTGSRGSPATFDTVKHVGLIYHSGEK